MNELSGLQAKLMDERVELPKPKNAMGKDDFMKLLMAQLQHQDPLKPMDHQEFAAQLAQFGQLEQLTNIGSGISGLKAGMGDDAKLQAISMIGKRIAANGSEVELISGQNVALSANLPESVKPVKAQISDANGRLVREIDLKENSKEILWDGKDQDGTALPSGKYQFRVQGAGPNGMTQDTGSELSGRVVGVEMDGTVPTLVVQSENGQSKIAMAKVRRVMVDDGPKTGGSIVVANAAGPTIAQAKPQVEAPLVAPAQVEIEPPVDDEGMPPLGHDPNAMFVKNLMEVMRR
ncbi:MAG: flagellar hook assembly protein FlgD [Deltaproteobacteria bacterium]|nr:flagellar hook assembly protein FlgD [Deltaproteobacteria bacterium]